MPSIFISGANSGLGLAMALRFARAGYRALAGTRSLAKGEEARREARAQGLEIELVELDVDRDDSVARAVREVQARVDRLDVLVNNAGLGVYGVAEELPIAELARVMETNFFGAFRLTQAFLPQMRRQRGGEIAFMSSWMGRVTQPGMVSYAASKAALECFAETLAQEVLRFDIAVRIIEPGYAKTPMHRKAPRYERPESSPYEDLFRNWVHHWRVGHRAPTLPEEVADAYYDAVAKRDPRLRLVIGDDARQWVEARARTSDEVWREAGRIREEAEFLEWARRTYGAGLFEE